jgi:hypothetical protein
MTSIIPRRLYEVLVSEATRLADAQGRHLSVVHIHAARANVGHELDREFRAALAEQIRGHTPSVPASPEEPADDAVAATPKKSETRASRVGKPKRDETSEANDGASSEKTGDDAAAD